MEPSYDQAIDWTIEVQTRLLVKRARLPPRVESGRRQVPNVPHNGPVWARRGLRMAPRNALDQAMTDEQLEAWKAIVLVAFATFLIFFLDIPW